MHYMLLIYADQSQYPKMKESEIGELMGAYQRFTTELKGSGALVGANRLQPTIAATTVRVRAGKTLLTDGPFAETKEQLGGYYLIDVPNLDEALRWAAKLPSSAHGSIEVRPVWV